LSNRFCFVCFFFGGFATRQAMVVGRGGHAANAERVPLLFAAFRVFRIVRVGAVQQVVVLHFKADKALIVASRQAVLDPSARERFAGQPRAERANLVSKKKSKGKIKRKKKSG
jgi:hypothetical protein